MPEITNVKGWEDLKKAMQAVPSELATRHMGPAVKSGAQVIGRKMRENARNFKKPTGRLASFIGVGKVQWNAKGAIYAVGLRKGHKIGHLVEFGSAAHDITASEGGALLVNGVFVGKTVRHPGSAPTPFLRAALEWGQWSAMQAIGDYLKRAFGVGLSRSVLAPSSGGGYGWD